MSLIDDVREAKLRAGENAVCKHLADLGLIDKPKETELKADARRYRFLKNADIHAVYSGGLFAGKTPDNIVLNGSDLDEEIDKAMNV